MTTKRNKKGLSLYRPYTESNKQNNPSSLYCWGEIPKENKTYLELLRSSNKTEDDFSLLPTKLKVAAKSSPVVSVAASPTHAICVTNEFKLFGSGSNSSGQLLPFNNNKKRLSFASLRELPLTRNNLKIVQVSCGSNFTAYLTNNGRVYSYGGNEFGQLGHSSDRRIDFLAPRMVQGVPHEVLVQVCCGASSTYVLTKHGKVYSCGLGKNGRLGVADANLFLKNHYALPPRYISEMRRNPELSDKEAYLTQNKIEMTEVTGPLKGCPIVSIAAGDSHVLAVSNTGAVYGWGSNEHFQLGIPESSAKGDIEADSDVGFEDTDGVPLPVRLDIDGITSIAAGSNHSIFLSLNRKQLFVAGDNHSQQLGPIPFETAETIVETKWEALTEEESPVIVKVACGSGHTALLLKSGNLLLLGEKAGFETKAALKDVEVEQVAKAAQLVSSASAFDVACGGNMTFLLSAPHFDALLDQAIERHNVLKVKYPIGFNGDLPDKLDSKETFIKLRKVLFDMQTLNASFLLPEEKRRRIRGLINDESIETDLLCSSFIDVENMLKATKVFAAAAYSDQQRLKVRQLAAHIVAKLEINAPTITEADQLRAYFILAVSPILAEICPAEHEVVLVSIFKLPLETRRMFFSWVYTDLACKDVKLLLDSLVKPMLNQLDSHVRRRKFTKQAIYLCKFLQCLYEICMKINEESNLRTDEVGFQSKAHIPSAEFYTKALDSFPDGALEEMYKKWEAVVTQGGPELNGQRANGFGMFGMRMMHLNNQILNGEGTRERIVTDESLRSIHYEARPIEGNTYGLTKFGTDLVSFVDNTLEDTLSDISPDLVFFKHPFLLSATTKRRFMRIDDNNMHNRHVLHSLVRTMTNPHLIFEVRRGVDLLSDTFNRIRELLKAEDVSLALRRPLKIKFSNEEGLDAGGVRKEFFLLLSQDLFSPQYQNFKEIPGTGLVWFNDGIDPDLFPENRISVTFDEYLEATRKACTRDRKVEDFEIIGVVMGLAMYNDTLLDVQFPSAMYQLLLNNFDPDKLDIGKYKHFDPEGARQLEYLKTIESEADMAALDMTFEITHEKFGVVNEVELCENGSKMTVTLENLEEYIGLYIRFKMYSPFIETQAKALRKGFTRVISAQHAALKLFNTDELELLLCGTPELDFAVLKENCAYEGGFSASHKTVKWFWEILEEMNYEQRKMFLKFSTGSSRAPIGGLKNVRFKVQRAGPDSPQLPTSHTCFNTFMLPEYSSKEKMRRLMLLAIENSEGFGLQ